MLLFGCVYEKADVSPYGEIPRFSGENGEKSSQ
jgi:hypothetical protein